MRKDTNAPKNQAHQRHPAKHHQVSRLHLKKRTDIPRLFSCQGAKAYPVPCAPGPSRPHFRCPVSAFSPPRSGSGSSRMPAPHVTLSNHSAENKKSCTFAYNFPTNVFVLTSQCAEICTPLLPRAANSARNAKTQHRKCDAVFFLFRQIPVMSTDKRIFAPARSAVRSCTANDSRRDQNLRLRAASDFFLRLTEGFS